MKNFKELNIWKQGIQLVKIIYEVCKDLPADERFAMKNQLSRAVVSIPANIAEGSSRNSDKDYARFLQIALGSAFEVQTYLVIASEMGWANSQVMVTAENLLETEIKMIHSFIKKILGH